MLHLFDAFGIELEYMIASASTLDVLPISDAVLRDEAGEIVSDVDRGAISWSNELTHHVLELKTNGPAEDLGPLAGEFQRSVQDINRLLAPHAARLLPTAMHPWMDPRQEMRLWPHDYHVVYEAFHKIFDCRSHGWANLQSMHINLPFAGDEEFGRLHAAVRLILPLLPGLAASSPVVEGKVTTQLDSRLDVYRRNAKGVASVSGRVIPEPVYSQADYDRHIFQPMFRDIAPYDPQGVLQQEFLNARGAIARFSRGAIEIRVIDVQECPAADLAIAALTIAVLKLLVAQTWTPLAEQQQVSIDTLEPVLLAAIEHADQGIVRDQLVLRQFGIKKGSISLQELWSELSQQAAKIDSSLATQHAPALKVLFSEGCLARRILRECGDNPGPQRLREVYGGLADCLNRGEMFRAG